MPGLTTAGFEAKTYAAILGDMEERQRAALGVDWDTSPESPEGILNGIVANTAREVWEVGAGLYAALDRDGASGQTLTQVAALTGTNRRGVQRGRARLVLTVAAGATVPAGVVARVPTQPSNRWVTLSAAVNPTGAPLLVTVQAEQETPGPLPAPAATISEIATPAAGWLGVTNLEAASPGLDAESDPALRRRAEDESQGAGTTPAEAIRTALLRIPLVSDAIVWENTADLPDSAGRPPHSVEAMVTGGDSAAIAAVLWGAKARGIATHGSVAAAVADALGAARQVRFSRPVDVPVATVVRVKVHPRPDPGDAAIKAAVRAVYGPLRAGDAVLRAQITCAALDVRGVTNVLDVRLGRATPGTTYPLDLALGPRERATAPTDNHVTVQRA